MVERGLWKQEDTMTLPDNLGYGRGPYFGPYRKPRKPGLIARFLRWLAFVFLGVR
jgi:hypothetical protein